MEDTLARRAAQLALVIVLAAGMCLPTTSAHATAKLAAASLEANAGKAYAHEFEFTGGGIVVDGQTTADGSAKVAGDGYSISKKLKLTISSAGTYRVTGADDAAAKGIAVEASDVVLVLDDLTLATTDEAPVSVKKGLAATIDIEGAVTLTDNETDASNDGDPDGAAIKVGKGAAATITGTGTLTANGAYKNGIKGGQSAEIAIGATTADKVSVNVTAAKNGVASDGALIFNGGTVNVTAGNDGVKSSPDPDDTTSAGTIVVNGGSLTVNAEDEGIVAEPGSETVDGATATNTTAKSTIGVNGGALSVTSGGDGIRAEGDITILGGTFTVRAQHDGIQTNANMNIANGTFDIKTSTGGKNTTGKYSGDTSCKGLKANFSSDDGNASSKSTAGATNALNVTGGTFVLDTLDDAVHSDAYCTVTGGTFTINTGDDGMHADTSLTLGTEGGYERDPDVTIEGSYEGLEGGSVFAYSGKYRIAARDDGLNAADGSDSGEGPGQAGGQQGAGQGFNPGGQPNQGFRSAFGGNGNAMPAQPADSATAGIATMAATGDYQLVVKGGTFYVNCDGDGLDSNGALSLLGGDLAIFSQSNGDNVALDHGGTLTVNGATVFTAGSTPMMRDDVIEASSFGQGYVTKSLSGKANTVVNATSGNAVVRSEKLPKAASYFLYSAPSTTSGSLSIATGEFTQGAANAWEQTWTETATTAATSTSAGLTTYTSGIGTTERQTIPASTVASAQAPEATDLSGSADTDAGGSGGSSGSGNEGDSSTSGNANEEGSQTTGGSDSTEASGNTDGATGSETTKGDSAGADGAGSDTAADTRIDLSDAAVAKIANKGFTGSAIKPKPTVTVNGATLKLNRDYTLSYRNNVKRGTATVTVSAKDGSTAYKGFTTATFKIVKGANPVKVTATSRVAFSSQLKGSAKAVQAIKVYNARGTVKYTRAGGSKYLKVGKAGQVVVAKGTPAGTYRVKVKVRAAGTADFKAKTITKTVRVTVR